MHWARCLSRRNENGRAYGVPLAQIDGSATLEAAFASPQKPPRPMGNETRGQFARSEVSGNDANRAFGKVVATWPRRQFIKRVSIRPKRRRRSLTDAVPQKNPRAEVCAQGHGRAFWPARVLLDNEAVGGRLLTDV
jgi:hypothetical protein